jgi:hypothetical protein
VPCSVIASAAYAEQLGVNRQTAGRWALTRRW